MLVLRTRATATPRSRSVWSRASAAIDRGALRLMERRMAPRTPPLDDARERLRALARAYSDGTLGSPSRFFPEPGPAAVKLAPLGDGPLGTQVVDLSFRSEYVPFLPEGRTAYLAIV